MNASPRRLAPADIVSLSRLPLAGAFVLAGDTSTRLAVVAIAGITDWIDGWMARRQGSGRYGAIIDPAADRAFVVIVLAALVAAQIVTVAQCALLLVRDIATTVGALAVRVAPAWRPDRLQARRSGKVVTALQFVTLVGVMIEPSSIMWLLPIVVVASIVSIADYGRALWRHPARAAVLVAALTGATDLEAQERGLQAFRPIARIDAFSARVDALHAGIGVTRGLGSYVRLDYVIAAGAARVASETVASGRAEVVGRFLLDPFRQSRWGFYGGAGLLGRLDDGADPGGYVTLLFGAELPGEGSMRPAIELGIGGGTRIAFVLRRGRPDRR